MIIIPALWTFVLIINVILCITGSSATWRSVFVPMICMTIASWHDYSKERRL